MMLFRTREYADVSFRFLMLLQLFTCMRGQVQVIDKKMNIMGPDYIIEDDGVDLRKENSIYAAIEHMKPLAEVERRLINITWSYLKEQKDKGGEMSGFARSVEEAMYFSMDDDLDQYLGNPINCYMIIKRFTDADTGWKALRSREDIDISVLKDIKDIFKNNFMYLPSEHVDLLGATAALVRLMDSYDITAHEMAEGVIPGIQPALHQLTAKDCLDIAEIAHKSRRYVRMKEWLREAESLINDETNPLRHGNTTRMNINMYLSWAVYLENDIAEAVRYTKLVLQDNPNHEDALKNIPIYTWYVENNEPCTFPEVNFMKAAHEVLGMMMDSTYVQTCKKKNLKVIGVKNKENLRCFYNTQSPRLYLKPAKVTQMHDNPEVYILHNVMSDKKLQELKEIAAPRLTVAEVVNPIDGSRMTVPYRVAKSVFLMPAFPDHFPGDDVTEAALNPIFESVSGLSMDSGESLQINNYGLGGQYEFHHDYDQPGAVISASPDGNRIATLLLYMSDVEAGGETVFTEIGLSVPPEKGSALLWYNLHRNGSVFFNTKHASCPVLSGSKWVANKWIHEQKNEFRRRCTFNQFE